MKAIVVEQFGGPEVMRLKEIPELRPDAGQVLVEMKSVGVNPVEAYVRTGTYTRKPRLPYTPGTDGAGIVKAVGAGVKKFKPGDRVYTFQSISGTYGQFALCPENGVHKLPKNASFNQGAALGVPFATAYAALFLKAKVKAGETVLVHGATGGVGHAAVQYAKLAGAKVIGTAGTPEGEKFLQQIHSDFALNHADPEHFKKAMDITGGKGVDVIVEFLANANLAEDLKILGMRGRIVVVGNRGAIEINPRDLMAKDGVIFGMVLFNTEPGQLRGIHDILSRDLEKKRIDPVIGREIRLEDAPEAHEALMKPGARGKVVLIP